MPHSTSLCYAFDSFQFDVGKRVLTHAGKAVSLTPKATDILILLLRNAGQLVEKDELMKEVWPNTFVEEANVAQNIFTLRRAFDEAESGRSYIETVARRGYRFVADVRLAKAPDRGSRDLSSLDESKVDAPPSLAVLSFINSTGDEKFEYLAEGVTDNLTNNLSRIDKLRIISRSAVFRLGGAYSDPQEIGRALGVDAVLSGRVQLRDTNLCVSAQLIEVNSGWQLWGESFDLTLKDILEVQDEIARQISATLRLKLTGEEEKRITTRYTENSAAYQAYLEGRYHWSKYTKAGIEKAITHFCDAIELDPNYALAYSGIVDCYLRLATNYLPPETDLSRLAQNLPTEYQPKFAPEDKCLTRLTLRQEWDWKGAERELRRANELKASYPSAHQWQFAYHRSISLFQATTGNTIDRKDKTEGEKAAGNKLSQLRFCSKLTPTEEIQVLCTIAREQTQVGNYEAACLLMREWWQIGQWPTLNNLGIHACVDLLFTLGTLAGYLASARRVPYGQKHAETLLNGSIGFSEHLGSKWLASEARVELARCYYREGLFDLARSTARQALTDIGDLDDELKGICLVLLGTIERDAGKLRDSHHRLTEVAEMLTSSMPLVSSRYYHEMAITLKEMAISSFSKDYSQLALDHFHQASFALEAIGNHRHSAAAENNLGYLLLNLGRPKESEIHLLRAKRLFSHFGDDVRSAQVDDTLARLYLETDELALADATISNAVRILESTDEDGLLAEALTTQGLVLFKKSRPSEAKRAFEGAYRIAERCGDHEGAGRVLLSMTECLGRNLDEEERADTCRALKRLLALTQQASIVARLKQTLAVLDVRGEV